MMLLERRDFLKAGITSAGGLIVGVAVSGCGPRTASSHLEKHSFGVFLEISSDGRVLFQLSKPEIGQGVETGIPMFVCDELGGSWETFDVEIARFEMSSAIAALPDRPQFFTTGASNGVRRTWEPLRKMAAIARDMLERAAAARWAVAPEECAASQGRVEHKPSGRSFGFGELASEAAMLEPSNEPKLRSPSDYVLIGRPLPNRRAKAVVRGEERYAVDVSLPEMAHASIERAPTVSGKILSIDDSAARAVAGVIDVIPMDGYPAPASGNSALDVDFTMLMKPGVAVIGENPWAALKGRRALRIEWDDGPAGKISLEDFKREIAENLDSPTETSADVGAVEEALGRAATLIEGDYENPFQASFGLEPLNATARMTEDGGLEIWAGSQSPQMTAGFIAEWLDMPLEKITFHNMKGGGGFGRRFYCDFVSEAAALARKTGKPIKLMWTREDDIQHTKCHAYRQERHRIGLDEKAQPIAWDYTSSMGPNDWIGFHGSYVPYFGGLEHRRARWSASDTHLLHRGSWRSVMLHPQHFTLESAVDEAAHAAGEDPLEMRLRWLTTPVSYPGEEVDDEEIAARRIAQKRAEKVLRVAGEASGWGRTLPEGVGMGVALGRYIDTFVGQTAEVEIVDGAVRVRKLICAFDCGLVVNPNLVRSQVEGSLVWALGPVLFDAIDIQRGRVVQSNFHDYRLPRLSDTPEMEIILVESNGPPAGVGEPAVIALAPAVANAVFAATGRRVRTLPIRL